MHVYYYPILGSLFEAEELFPLLQLYLITLRTLLILFFFHNVKNNKMVKRKHIFLHNNFQVVIHQTTNTFSEQ